tara:strand:- start:196 stop:693 length:498 start_codon:yes stop_codon:yes gene_type:complete
MAGSLNKAILIGRLGQDPEVREVGSSKVANFSIATDESYTDREGNKIEKTEWHRIVMWNKAAENAEAFLRKGSLVYIEGKIETRSWQNDAGEKRYSTEIKSFSFQMLDNKNESNRSQDSNFTEKSVQDSFQKETSPKYPDSTNSNMDTQPLSQSSEEEKEDDLPF